MNEEEKSLATVQPNSLTSFDDSYNGLITFVKSKLKVDTDYGIIPGTEKKSLLKPGAEKIAFLFNLKPKFELVKEVEDWENGFFFYKYKCTLVHFHTGKPAGEAVRSCNSKEKKYSQKSVAEKWASEAEKAAAIGRKKVKKGQWENVYLILKKTPDEIAEQTNTIDAMAQKRALVAATVQATMATEIFDADISESDEEAPGKSVTKEEDPRRIKVINGLYGTASRHGWDNDWIHRAIKKKWGVESLKDCSNEQIEELKDFIAEKYQEVGEGNKPVLKGVTQSSSGPITPEPVQDGEIVDASLQDEDPEIPYTCMGPSHDSDKRPKTTMQNPWCSQECKEDYYGPTKSLNQKMETYYKPPGITGKENSIMIYLKTLQPEAKGQTVWYRDGAGNIEEGIIKSWSNIYIFVVYPGNNQAKREHWDRYTAAATKPEDLYWKKEEIKQMFKTCNTCGENKPIGHFSGTGEWGKTKARCNACNKVAREKGGSK